MFFNYYESNGWKVGRNPMKCWKSAARNWLKRLTSNNYSFPNFYSEKIEKEIKNNQELLTQYHKHLKKMGWKTVYSPTAGTKWIKK